MNFQQINPYDGHYIALKISNPNNGQSLKEHVKTFLSKTLFDTIKIDPDLKDRKITEVMVNWDGVTTEYTFDQFKKLIWE